MKKILGFVTALFISAMAMAQATPHEKEVLRNDVARERDKRHDVARDLFHGNPERAKEDHRAAVAYHKKAHRDARIIHHNAVRRAKARHYARRHHHYRHHYYHHRY
ncbi:MAG: hypothetical protein QM726_25875 [Chitinophagaceae bacterium]